MISGGNRQYIARSAAQVASTGGAWTQVIAPGSNTNGIFVSHLVCTDVGTDKYATWRAHTSTPASAADGVELGRVGASNLIYRFEVGSIIPAGQGLYVSSNANSTIHYQVL